ncbi:MAG: 4Fe-4S binding protein [Deltaproteobacteria bacterium]|nr:4Fe-4S binding protein [Deltaproteobacteria bacterium]
MNETMHGESAGVARWRITVDGEKCALCEVCSRHCPSGALRVEQGGAVLRLVFRPGLCHGCVDREGCEIRCTEGALARARDESTEEPAAEIVLSQCELVRCARCGEPHAPARKLRAVARRRRGKDPAATARCPHCRRTALAIRFVEEKHGPGSHTQSRSAREILRRAGHWRGA